MNTGVAVGPPTSVRPPRAFRRGSANTYLNVSLKHHQSRRKEKLIQWRQKNLEDNPTCIDQQLTKLLRIIGRARDQNHLDLLAAQLIKERSPVVCQQKDFCTCVEVVLVSLTELIGCLVYIVGVNLTFRLMYVVLSNYIFLLLV